MMPQPEEFWVFAYGSLMWRPGFSFLENRAARLYGYHRALCIWSIRYRGTPEKPGLVMGLKRGGSCVGRAYRVAEEQRADVTAYLDAREMLTNAYSARFLPVRLDDSRRVAAYGFVARPEHEQYASGLSAAETAAIVSGAAGSEGPAVDYLENTVAQLAAMGIRDRTLLRVRDLVTAP